MNLRHSSGHLSPGGLFLETLRPSEPTGKHPVVMLHGGAHTGACYLGAPDGRPGWAHDFVERGFPVLVPDWPGIGRSGHVPAEQLTGEAVCAGLAQVIAEAGEQVVLLTHSMSGAYGWKLLEMVGDRIAKLVAIAPSPPGNIQQAPDIVAETPGSLTIRGTTDFTLLRNAAFVATRSFALHKLVGTGTQFPAEQVDRYVDSLVAIPPLLLQQRLNVDASQLRVTDFTHYAGKPALVITGTHDVDHPRELDEPIADWLAANGAHPDYWYLGDRGILGNGHMMMLERNSQQLSAAITGWLDA